MQKLIKNILYDAKFIKDHELQPGWYKILKVFLLLGLGAGYFLIYGGAKTLIFLGIFFSLSLILHLIYRANTKKYTRSWLDFKVEEIEGQLKYHRIGFYYYFAVVLNGLLAFILSQLLG
jgi:hypothetical protein